MSERPLVDRIADAVLYEGYVLYPYRASTVKNRQRFTFGGVYPRAYVDANPGGDRWSAGCQCLVSGGRDARLSVRLRCLQTIDRTVGELPRPLAEWPEGEPPVRAVPFLTVGDRVHPAWQEAAGREFALPGHPLGEMTGAGAELPLRLSSGREVEPIRDDAGQFVGAFIRRHEAIEGKLTVSAERVDDALSRVSLRIENQTPLPPGEIRRDEALLRTFLSAHLILSVENGSFVSLLDPPAEHESAVEACVQEGLWPVLAGEPGRTDTVFCSPIILYDYPAIAPESPGDLFDGTEIDEILTLRIMTLTDEEKREVLGIDARARQLLERTEGLTGEQMMKLHGRMSPAEVGRISNPSGGDGLEIRPTEGEDPFPEWREERPGPEYVRLDGQDFRVGQRVRLRPKAKSDMLDIAMDGQTAEIETIEQDFEGRFYFTVTIDADPGRDLGRSALPGHRFFFFPDEVEPLPDE